MSRKPVIAVIIIFSIAILAVLGLLYARKMPEVSGKGSRKMLTGYREQLQGLYDELNGSYDRLVVENNKQGWEEFSRSWVPRLSASRPDNIDKRLPREYEGMKEVLKATQGAVLNLWNEYNKDFTGEGSNPVVVDDLKNCIESTFKSLSF